MKTPFFLPVVAALLLAVPSHGQDTAYTRSTLANLPGVAIKVAGLSAEIEDRGMTPFVIAVEVEGRLKKAGIPVLESGSPKWAPGLQTLYVEVNAILDEYSERCTWSVRLDLMQAARLERNPDSTAVMASTWSVGGVGFVTTDWRKAIIDDVIHYTEEFIEAFAAANPDGVEP